jgi:dienelactone hydrolase
MSCGCKFWVERGYVALLVDSFGPRGYARGFEAGTNDGSRPASVNEITVRPLDAYAALKFLRGQPGVIKDKVFLQGWSNGGSTALVCGLDHGARHLEAPTEATGFRAFLSMYPACAQVMRRFTSSYRSYAPMLLLIGTDDEEVNPERCAQLSGIAERNGSDWQFVLYPGVEHSYDTPTRKRESVQANKLAARTASSARKSSSGNSSRVERIKSPSSPVAGSLLLTQRCPCSYSLSPWESVRVRAGGPAHIHGATSDAFAGLPFPAFPQRAKAPYRSATPPCFAQDPLRYFYAQINNLRLWIRAGISNWRFRAITRQIPVRGPGLKHGAARGRWPAFQKLQMQAIKVNRPTGRPFKPSVIGGLLALSGYGAFAQAPDAGRMLESIRERAPGYQQPGAGRNAGRDRKARDEKGRRRPPTPVRASSWSAQFEFSGNDSIDAQALAAELQATSPAARSALTRWPRPPRASPAFTARADSWWRAPTCRRRTLPTARSSWTSRKAGWAW